MAKKWLPLLKPNYTVEYNIDQKPLVRLENVQKSFKNKDILIDVTLDIKQGENIAIIGHNGSGKSTLVDIIGRINTPTKGLISFKAKDDREIGRMTSTQVQTLNVPEGYKVSEVVNYFHKAVDITERLSKLDLHELVFNIFGMGSIWNQTLSSLSGGQQQRVNLIITILRRPSLLILDEVATGLDAEVYGKVIDFIENYTSNPDVTLILISHKYSEIKKLTDRTILVKDGIISKSLATKALTKVKFEDFTHEELISSKETIDREMFKDWEKGLGARLAKRNNDKVFTKRSQGKVTKNTIEINSVHKNFGTLKALQDISLTITKGDKIAFLGKNGSGKSTLAEIIAQTQDPTLGSVKYFWGHTKSQIVSGIGMQFQQNLFPNDLTVKDVLWFFASASHKAWNSNELLQATEAFRMTKLLKNRAGSLSSGEKQRLNILISLLKKPELLIIDEISTGLDIQSIKQITLFLQKYFRENEITLILISHNYEEIKSLTNKAFVIDEGKLSTKTYNIKSMSLKQTKKLLLSVMQPSTKKGGK